MHPRTLAALAALFTIVPGLAFAQATSPQSGTYISAAEVKAVIDEIATGRPGIDDQAIRIVDIGTGNLSIAVVSHKASQPKPGQPVGMYYHTKTTEVYYMLSGSGTLYTGGTFQGPGKAVPADHPVVKVLNGPTITGTSQGAQSQVANPGDVIVVPQGVPHGWGVIPDHVTYIRVMSDPDRVLPLGYINPAATSSSK